MTRLYLAIIVCVCHVQQSQAWSGNNPFGRRASSGRRDLFEKTLASLVLGNILVSLPTFPASATNDPFRYSDDWTATSLPLLNLPKAVEKETWDMGRWPDPILRRPAQVVESKYFGTDTLIQACRLLKKTAIDNKAVGLAAQQCGVNARIVYLQSADGILQQPERTMINPRIVQRSPEIQMRTWKEHCLVLPPSFYATVLRDDWIDVVYQDTDGTWHLSRLTGEMARAAQHEFDHDRGILVTDHVSLEEMESDGMRSIERQGHDERMVLAYTRQVQYPIDYEGLLVQR